MNLAGKRYQWRVMPMGIKNGPAIFQRVMDHVLQGLDCADVYIDDIIIGSSGATEEELLANHDRDVRAVLDRLRKEELVASVSKTDFFVRSVEFCGHVLENGTRRPAPGKMLALERWDKPDNVRELRGFLGLASSYSGYVQNYASIATPLINMLKDLPKHKNGKKIGLTWNASANEAFLKLKRAITDTIQSTLSLCLRCQAMLLPMPLRPLLLTTRSGFMVRTTVALKIGLRRTSKPWGVPLHAKHVGMNCSLNSTSMWFTLRGQ